MWIQKVLLLASSTAVLCLPAPTPTPISVYQQGNEEQQDYQLQYRQPVQYKQQLVQQVRPAAARALYKAQAQNPRLLQQETESEDYEMAPPQPYQFSFDVNDDENTNYQNRKEQREGNKISGSYSVVDADGFIRTVTYTADPVEGFKAHVSREPTNIVVKVPTPQPSVENSQASLYSVTPKLQYSAAPGKQVGIQYNGAPVPRQPIARPHQVVDAAPRRQQTQQYLQGTQDLIQYQPIYQAQGSLRHSQAISTAGQINQFLAETSPQAAQLFTSEAMEFSPRPHPAPLSPKPKGYTEVTLKFTETVRECCGIKMWREINQTIGTILAENVGTNVMDGNVKKFVLMLEQNNTLKPALY